MFRALFGVPHLFARELLMNSPHLRFLDIHVAKNFKNTPLKTILKYLDLSQSYDCFCNTLST